MSLIFLPNTFHIVSILVCLGCYKKNTTGWVANNINLYLTVLEVGILRLGYQPDQVWALSWGSDFLLYPYRQRGKRVLLCFFYKGTNPDAGKG